jgi:hypothetical protein
MVSITKWLIVGLVGAFAISALVDPARASGTASAFGGVGTALGNLGRGVQGLLTGTGTGVSKLFNPLFTLRDLIYGPQGGVQVGKDVAEVVSTTPAVTVQDVINTQKQIELDPRAPFTPLPFAAPESEEYWDSLNYSDPINQGFSYSFQPSISPAPVAQVTVHGQSLPLSQAAISYYQSKGVTVSPSSNQTVASQNSGNATGVSSASSNFQAGAAQAAGYSLGGMALTNPGRGWTGKPSPAPTNINRGSSGRRSAARTRGGKTAGQSRTKR